MRSARTTVLMTPDEKAALVHDRSWHAFWGDNKTTVLKRMDGDRVVAQCNLIVAVYMTMPDGRLLRFDKNANVPSEQLMHMAYSATRSERVEVSCNDAGAAGYETHEPV